MLVDTLGLLLGAWVLPADISDAEGGLDLVADAARRFGRLRKLWADSAYAGAFEDWVATRLGWDVEVVQRSAEQTGFVVQRKRWIVERTLAWLSKCRAILIRWDKKAENYLGLLKLACILLWFRRYQRLGGL